MKPTVAVCIPAFNAERTIAGAIQSIRRQTCPPDDIVVVDDGSTDKTAEIAEKFHDVRLVRAPHHGVADARNLATERTVAEWIVMQDADDYSLPNRIERILPLMHTSDVIVHGLYVNVWNEQFQCLERTYKPPLLPNDTVFRAQKTAGVCAYKRTLWKAKPFRSNWLCDWVMHVDWFMHGANYAALDEGLYEYIRYLGSASHKFEKHGMRRAEIQEFRKIFKKEYGRKFA